MTTQKEMSLTATQRAILRDMAGGAELSWWDNCLHPQLICWQSDRPMGRHLPHDLIESWADAGYLARQRCNDAAKWLYHVTQLGWDTLTPAGAEAAREGTE